MIKLLGLADIIAAILMLVAAFATLRSAAGLVALFGIYLLIKGILFLAILRLKDLASFADVIGGILLLFSISAKVSPVLMVIFALFILQKGFFTLIGR